MEAVKEIESHIRRISNLSRENERLRRQVIELKNKFKKHGQAGLQALEEIELLLFNTENTENKTPPPVDSEKK